MYECSLKKLKPSWKEEVKKEGKKDERINVGRFKREMIIVDFLTQESFAWSVWQKKA